MRKVVLGLMILIPVIAAIGCSSQDTTAQEAPKGARPDTVNAPPGAKNPEERGREEEKAANPNPGAKDPNQDGGGQDGK